MFQRLLMKDLSRSMPFCLFGAIGAGKTTLIRDFAGKFSNWIHLDLETAVDRAIFNFDVPAEETLKAISFLKGKEIRGNGTLIVLDELYKCPEAIRWLERWTDGQADRCRGAQVEGRTGGRADRRTDGQVAERASGELDGRPGGRAVKGTGEQGVDPAHGNIGTKGPFVIATSSVMSAALAGLTDPEKGKIQSHYLHPFSFEEFLMALDDLPAIGAFREVPVPNYAYEKLLNYFHLYALIGGMPEIISEYATTRHLTGLKNIYEKIESRFIHCLEDITAGAKSRELTMEVLQNTYPYAATRISFNRFGNLEKGSREIGRVFRTFEQAFLLRLLHPVTAAGMPLVPDKMKFPRIQMLDTGLVNYFSGIQKPLFRSHDMNAIFEGQIARQAVGQEMLATERPFKQEKENVGLSTAGINRDGFETQPALTFWVRNKAQSTAEVDFIIPYDDLAVPVVVKSGEPGRLRSLHQFIDLAPHSFAVRLYAGKLTVQQTQTIRGKKFYLLNLPYFLAGKIKDHLKGFIRLANGG